MLSNNMKKTNQELLERITRFSNLVQELEKKIKKLIASNAKQK